MSSGFPSEVGVSDLCMGIPARGFKVISGRTGACRISCKNATYCPILTKIRVFSEILIKLQMSNTVEIRSAVLELSRTERKA
jgi:hypothetical protein